MSTSARWNRQSYSPGGGNRLTLGVKVSYRFTGPLFERCPEIVERAIRDATRATLQYGKPLIAGRTPVDTGLLRSSWHYLTATKSIFNEVPYSIFVEWGTSRMAAREMAQQSLPEIEAHFSEQISRRLDALG